jgi:hypothetical protein
MKQSKKSWQIYLALFLLIFLILLPFKEGFDGHKWLDFSGWFTGSDTTTNHNIPRNEVTVSKSNAQSRVYNPHYNNNEGTGNSGRKYKKTEDDNDELTSNEKTYGRSALNKLIAMHDNNDVLKSCINKIKVYL